MSRRVVLFTVLRLAAFIVPLTALLWLGFDWWWAAILATIVGACVSFLALNSMRESIALDLARKVDDPEPDVDAEFEDASTE
ncbi:MAG: DUF4229 domain-containing protein [Cryobacterium sp.]|nr:DUF4229 domain-containing protein [Cryobacterium sp.]